MIDNDPFDVFARWFAFASVNPSFTPHAFLATATLSGVPSLRTILLKSFDSNGFVFFTNAHSTKGVEIAFNSYVSLLFYWPFCGRQIRIEGRALLLDSIASDDYFATRPVGSRLAAWASLQSHPLPSMAYLWERMASYGHQFSADSLPRPPHWQGYCIRPYAMEFWRNSPFRLHRRWLYARNAESWSLERLFP